MTIRSVTFDLDGTLLDTIADLVEACQRMLSDLKQPIRAPSEIHSFVGRGMAVLVERCLTDGQPPDDERLQEGIALFRRHYADVNGVATRIYPDVIEGLRAFRGAGYKMAVVTNKPAEFTGVLLQRTGLAVFFDTVVAGDTTAHQKPHPEPILHACRILGTRPVENLHIGDSKNDIQAAGAAGCPVFCVPYGYNEGQAVDSADCHALVSGLVAAYARLESL